MMQALEKQPMTDIVDRKAFAVLAKEHHRNLLAYARALTKDSHTSRDIVQDAKLEGCLKKLPETLSLAVQTFYYEGHSGEEAAEALDLNSATLRKRLERARTGLRECLQS